ncbi:acetate kinase [Variovorax sp. J22R133]|uniref:acetate kinase n=1 Tax=Variovorax brevis TaxID=3053503 RepID=UPI00257493C3|nr:acetate kinase [Variovorax sp. J22R133]MDM0112572.1 acetate kinase [Variovorax sp. J22R133]
MTAQTQTTRTPAANGGGTARRVDALQQQLDAQAKQIEMLSKQLAEQDARYKELQENLAKQQEAIKQAAPLRAPGSTEVETAKAGAAGAAGAAAGAKAGSATAASAGVNPPTNGNGHGKNGNGNGERPVQVGVAPRKEEQAPPIAQLFDEPSVLTPKGRFVIEPSFQYGYSSNDRVALVGYTVIPAILIGLIDVREVKRNTLIPTITGRWGVTSKLELEAKVPYVIRDDETVSREIFTGASVDNVFQTKGNGIGDIEFAARYQLASAKDNWPYMVGGLRFKSRTGKDPFEVVTDCVNRCLGNTTGTGLPLDAATGSGFYSLQPSLTWLFPSDPAVFFGGINYTYNFARSDVTRKVLNDQTESLGKIKPGDVWGLNFGMGLSVNERSSFSLGVELYSVGPTQQNGQTVRGSVRTQLASLLLGYSLRVSEKTVVNVSVGAGLTRDTPDLTLTVRVPVSF